MAGRDAPSALDALLAVCRTASEHLSLLEDGAARADVDLDQLSAATLPLLLDALGAAAAAASQTPGLEDSDRTQLVDLAARIEARRARQTQVQAHLDDLAKAWRCTRCGSNTVDGASISRAGGAATVRLECRRCRAKSPLSAEGRAMFDRVFQKIAARDVDWSRHGFEVDAP